MSLCQGKFVASMNF